MPSYEPVLPGFYPDPSVCRVGEEYFLVTSSFEFFPGIPLFHSRDLVNWTQIGHVLDRPEQLNLDGIKPAGGLYAPTIRYCDGVFYVVCTLFGRGGNFVVTTTDPFGSWSDPMWLEDAQWLLQPPNSVVPWVDSYFDRVGENPLLFDKAPGIDPSLFFENGRCWYTGNRLTENPDDPWYAREIWIDELDLSTMKLKGERRRLWGGISGVFTEGSHIYKKGKYYYLLVAEGGTWLEHSLSIARSENLLGPYESCPRNPIFTQRHLGKRAPVTGVGHGDFVETAQGEWYLLFLGNRPYGGYYSNLGRETFVTNVYWEDDWPVVMPVAPQLPPQLPARMPFQPVKDRFAGALAPQWCFLRTPRETFWSQPAQGGLRLWAKPWRWDEDVCPTAILRRQQHMSFSAHTKITVNGGAGAIAAGMAVIGNSRNGYILSADGQGKVSLQRMLNQQLKEIGSLQLNGPQLRLRIRAKEQNYTFEAALQDGPWQTVFENADGRIVSWQQAEGFSGAMLYLFAQGENGSYADFDWFVYEGE